MARRPLPLPPSWPVGDFELDDMAHGAARHLSFFAHPIAAAGGAGFAAALMGWALYEAARLCRRQAHGTGCRLWRHGLSYLLSAGPAPMGSPSCRWAGCGAPISALAGQAVMRHKQAISAALRGLSKKEI